MTEINLTPSVAKPVPSHTEHHRIFHLETRLAKIETTMEEFMVQVNSVIDAFKAAMELEQV